MDVNYCVIYATQSGNTRKVAEEIADELDCNAFDIESDHWKNLDLSKMDLVFIGSGVYGGRPHRSFQGAAEKISQSGAKLAFFFTWLGRGKSIESADRNLRKILGSGKATLLKGHFSCLGQSFFFFNRNRPNKDDFEKARAWAQKLYMEKSEN